MSTDVAPAPAARSVGTEPILTIERMSASYGPVTIVREVDLEVRPGEIVALLGPNGAGKTTTLLACSGFVGITAGDIRLDGTSVKGVVAHKIARRGLAHVPEDRSLWGTLTIDEHLRLAAKDDIADAYEVFPAIAAMKNKRSGLLSGGEQQMLAMARALVSRPQVLLVDEMSMGVAPVIVERMFDALGSIAASRSIGVLLVEQHVHLALKYADRGYVMSSGRLAASGTSGELSARWDDIQASYLGGAR